ncbi:hypothetical protein CONPUDRAFT_161045 [Coniophora puteana RWD-64-598 SS2]|uniref:Vps72/YL1 C-terminal domain-containing protein n=1 Tax=Coniophora puteana (strain RWD-64-598) TaxID=741705 RepID=A0A5M3N4S0_CONPW|nr:uncharacterized protein CONPUDRAFT_161045 [Coniophora puteana RWD-64-598 SS2]EIW86247.1 hypothetical protein CONPUDRAFT_161045 [Coniophora puteana RWD-64-598 SS2]
MDESDTLVARRPKRSTAGNRMEVALAELELEDVKEVEEDNDFVIARDEEDEFESDFESTDEEAAAQEDVEAGEQAAKEEERSARTRLEKATAAAHARQKVTFQPDTSVSSSKPTASKPKRRVSLGVTTNAETGETVEGAKRSSKRRYTVANTSATATRVRDAKEKKATVPKKAKIVSRMPTQDELIARALDTEEGNIVEHRDYLRLEEEKRAKARVVRPSISGPVLRWISKREETTVIEQPPPPPPPPAASGSAYGQQRQQWNFVCGPSAGSGTTPYTAGFQMYAPAVSPTSTTGAQRHHEARNHAATEPTHSSQLQGGASSSAYPSHPRSETNDAGIASAQPPQSQDGVDSASVSLYPSHSPSHQHISATSAHQPPQPPQSAHPVQPAPIERKEDVCKNYIIHELSQISSAKAPPWKDTMAAMFGDHVRWEDLRVFSSSKQRPTARPQQLCALTGLPAPYLDPRTGVPFANSAAYRTLGAVVGHEYVWSDALGCYVSRAREREGFEFEPARVQGGAGAGSGRSGVSGGGRGTGKRGREE